MYWYLIPGIIVQDVFYAVGLYTINRLLIWIFATSELTDLPFSEQDLKEAYQCKTPQPKCT